MEHYILPAAIVLASIMWAIVTPSIVKLVKAVRQYL